MTRSSSRLKMRAYSMEQLISLTEERQSGEDILDKMHVDIYFDYA